MIFVERTDLLFQNPVRPISKREWREIGLAVGLKALLNASDVDSVDFDACTVFVIGKRITFFAQSGSPDIAGEIMRRLQYPTLERIAFRSRNERSLRTQIVAFRTTLKGTVGAALVSGDTVLFHPEKPSPLASTVVAGEGLRFKIELEKIPTRVQTALKGPQGRADFLKLLKFQALLSGFTFAEIIAADRNWRVVARRGEEFFLLSIPATSKSFKIRIDLDLQVGGKGPRLAASNGIDALCDLFQAKQQEIDVLHALASDINLMGLSRKHWQPHALGPREIRSELETDESKLDQSLKIGASA